MSKLQYLVTLKLSNNQINSITHFNKESEDESSVRWKNLMYLDLSGNKINELPAIKAPKLKTLNLRANEIKRIDKFEGHESLEHLDLSDNQLIDPNKLTNMPNLKELYLRNNKLRTFPTLEGLASLKKLHVRNNMVT